MLGNQLWTQTTDEMQGEGPGGEWTGFFIQLCLHLGFWRFLDKPLLWASVCSSVKQDNTNSRIGMCRGLNEISQSVQMHLLFNSVY